MMLKAIAAVAAELNKICQPRELTIQTIAAVFRAKTVLDEIVFVQFDTPPSNPIWGEFQRYRRQPGVYASFNTVAEIRYAMHLLDREDWLRFVVTKELCHALEAPQGQHEVENGTMDELVSKFSLYSHQRGLGAVAPAYETEILAEIAAVELLCPIEVREAQINADGVPNDDACAILAKEHNLPLSVVRGTFDEAYNSSIRDLLNGN